jgi:flagellar protein FliO/FliZ
MTKLIPLSRAVAQVAAVPGACLLAFACPAAAYSPALKGGESTPLSLTSTTGTQASSTGGASLTRTIVGLAIVLAVIWGLWWVLRQVKSGREPSVESAGLASVAALTLASGRSVHLVRVGSDYVLLGLAEQSLVPIHRYTEEEARAAGLPMLAEAGAASRPRRMLLGGSSAQTNMTGPSEVSRPDPMRMSSPSTSVVERLRELTVRR